MRLSVTHTTRYAFAAPVAHALQRLRLTPKSTQGQEVVDWSTEFENARPELEYEDQHHNRVTLVSVQPGATSVSVTCRGIVDTHDFSGVIGHHAGQLPLWSFLGQTRRTRPGPAMRRIARRFAGTASDRLALLHQLSSDVLASVAYVVGSTGPDTLGEQAAAAGAGVCQDHAHIFIGCARELGVPARYVSGYLMMNDRIDQDATHAWAEAHVDGLGWVGFDISNGISPDARYVRVATGRDYGDAAPVTGITLGAPSTDLHVEVAVEQHQVQQQ
mgnify:FL=1